MFTGAFKDMSRSEAKLIAENNGGKVLSSVSKKLDFLIVGDSKPTKKKNWPSWEPGYWNNIWKRVD